MALTDKKVVKLSLFLFLATFALLYALEYMFEPRQTLLSEIDRTYLTKNVYIPVTIEKQSLRNNILFLTLTDGNTSIEAIAFSSEHELEKDKKYVVKGKVTLYNQKLEIIVTEITPLHIKGNT